MARVKALNIRHAASPHEIVTISIGATTLPPNEDLLIAMARADMALYKAKNNGRAMIEWG